MACNQQLTHSFAHAEPIHAERIYDTYVPLSSTKNFKPMLPPIEPSTITATGTNKTLNESMIVRLMEQGYTRGLAKSLSDTKLAFGNRIWIVDNSGSMMTEDGHRTVVSASRSDSIKFIPCSRWEEIQECVMYHIRLADSIQAPTTFRLLNKPGAHFSQRFGVAGQGLNTNSDETTQTALSIMRNTRPFGSTPLMKHITDIQREVREVAPMLRATGQRWVIVIATDGLPTGEWGMGGIEAQRDFVHALRTLEGYPVWVVIRLCTDEESVVDFYNELDASLELSVEVLDDYRGEAVEVQTCNPWLNYGLPLHRMREMGYHDRVFDMLDERLLTKSELRDFCILLFGEIDGLPDPSLDWDGFASHVERELKKEKLQWNPIRRKMKPWISMKKLNRRYSPNRSCLPFW